MDLRRELELAEEEDTRRKKVDDMKKRAIHNASSYDEFRHMVSCAELKPLKRKEIESLAAVKRGWRRSTDEQSRHRCPSKTATDFLSNSKLSKPRNHSEFERDWRRSVGNENNMMFLLDSVTAKTMPLLFRVELNAIILGQILTFLHQRYMTNLRLPRVDCVTVGQHQEGEGMRLEACAQWLLYLSKCGHFSLNVRFLDAAELSCVKFFLDEYRERRGGAIIEEIIAAYRL